MPRLRMLPSIGGAITLIIAVLCIAAATASAAYLTTSRARQASVRAMRHEWSDAARVHDEGCHRSNATHVDCVVAATWPNTDKDDTQRAVRVWVTLAHGVLIVHPAWHGHEEVIDVR